MIQITSGLIFVVGLSLITVGIAGILVTYAIDLYEEKKYGKPNESAGEVTGEVSDKVSGEKEEENGVTADE